MPDKGLEALEKYHKKLTEDNPRYISLLTRVAVEAYIANTGRDGKPKSDDAGQKVYDAMFNFLVNNYYGDPGTETGRSAIKRWAKQDLGVKRDMLGDLIKRGVDFVPFYEHVVKSTVGNFNKALDEYSEQVLDTEHMTPTAKQYLVDRAKKLEIRGLEEITEDAIKSIDEFRAIAKGIAEHKRRP